MELYDILESMGIQLDSKRDIEPVAIKMWQNPDIKRELSIEWEERKSAGEWEGDLGDYVWNAACNEVMMSKLAEIQ